MKKTVMLFLVLILLGTMAVTGLVWAQGTVIKQMGQQTVTPAAPTAQTAAQQTPSYYEDVVIFPVQNKKRVNVTFVCRKGGWPTNVVWEFIPGPPLIKDGYWSKDSDFYQIGSKIVDVKNIGRVMDKTKRMFDTASLMIFFYTPVSMVNGEIKVDGICSTISVDRSNVYY